MSLPFLVVGDAPNLSTGLGRIARDLTSMLHNAGIPVAQLGYGYDESSWPWRVFSVRDTREWGQGDLHNAWWKAWGGQRGVVLTVWDPARCFSLSEVAGTLGVQLWGYFAIDSTDVNGIISGPALFTMRRYQRVLAYTRWGAGVLKESLGHSIQFLPHGLDFAVWHAGEDHQLSLVGAVAANQPRKDFGLLFETFARLKDKDSTLSFWLHTDKEIPDSNGGCWVVQQLQDNFGLDVIVTTSMADFELVGMYRDCLVTIAPGLGEGFGYPIVESLACGTPVIHCDWAGGADLIPVTDWKIRPSTWRLEGAYAVKRPVMSADSMAAAAWRAIEWKRKEPEVVRAYCHHSVRHLGWDIQHDYWMSWIRQGLKAMGVQ